MITYKLHACFPVAEVGTDRPSYTVPEDVEQLEVWISITSGQKVPGQECQIVVATTDGTAEGELRGIVNSFMYQDS